MSQIPDPPGAPVRRARRAGVVVVAVILAAVTAAASWITIPYYAEGPGPAREVTPLIDFEGPPRYEPAGRLAMTTVSFEKLTPITALAAWLDPQRTIIEQDLLYEPGADRELEDRTAFSQMDQSKIDATVVVLRELAGYPERHGRGVLIESTASGCPAFDRLFPGDRVVTVDGEPIGSVREASRIIGSTPPGEEMVFDLDVDGQPQRATFARERCLDGREPLVGVSMVEAFPFPVSISSGDVGGPSAGLMWAVGLYELLTPGDLTDGRFVAGTGTIDLEGRVGPIGGIRDKVAAAREAGVEVFLVPRDNMAELAGLDTGDIEIVPVDVFGDALLALDPSAAAA